MPWFRVSALPRLVCLAVLLSLLAATAEAAIDRVHQHATQVGALVHDAAGDGALMSCEHCAHLGAISPVPWVAAPVVAPAAPSRSGVQPGGFNDRQDSPPTRPPIA